MDSDNVPYAPDGGNERMPSASRGPSSNFSGVSRLLVVAPNWLGDAVMALPAIADARRAAPGARLTVAARPSIAALFTMAPGVDAILTLDSKRSIAADTETIRAGGFDAALLLPNSWRSAMTVWRAGVKHRWGYRRSLRGPLLTVAPAAPSEVHQAVYYQRLTAALGAQSGQAVSRLVVEEAQKHAAASFLAEEGWDGSTPLVALAPGAAYGGAKRWPSASFGELANGLIDDGVRPVLIGGQGDRVAGLEVIAAMRGGRAVTGVTNLIGRTDLPALAAVLALSRMLVSNDSGAMHVASAIGIPVTALFGPTDEEATHPIGAGPRHVLTHRVWCRPCMLRECPLDHRCMTGITVDRVRESTRSML